MWVTAGLTGGEKLCRMPEGIASGGQMVQSARSLETSSSFRERKEQSEAPRASWSGARWSGSENWLLMVETFSVKYEANFSAVDAIFCDVDLHVSHHSFSRVPTSGMSERIISINIY